MIRDICDRHNILMIVDEVVTGFGRTGKNFAIEHWQGVVPDIMTTGKGLSSGYTPISATITREEIYEAIHRRSPSFTHGHTYGGNPLSCATALAVQNYIEDHERNYRLPYLLPQPIRLCQLRSQKSLSRSFPWAQSVKTGTSPLRQCPRAKSNS